MFHNYLSIAQIKAICLVFLYENTFFTELKIDNKWVKECQPSKLLINLHGLCILILLLRNGQWISCFNQFCSKIDLFAKCVFVLYFEWLSADLPLLSHRGYLLEKYDNPVLARS